MEKIVDKAYCMSSYLAFRYVLDENKIFKDGVFHINHEIVPEGKKRPCKTADDIGRNIQECLSNVDLSHAGVLLSGGMDSAIIASYMPEGTKAYTAKCIGKNAVDETIQAKKYCDLYGLDHVVVDVSWNDYDDSMNELMPFQGFPIVSNEPQAYKIAKQAKKDGIKCLIHGDAADIEFGGMSLMMSKDWTLDEWIERSIYVRPEKVLVAPVDIYFEYEKYRLNDNKADYLSFIKTIYGRATAAALTLACRCMGLTNTDPYEEMVLTEPFDLQRIRKGDSKYLLRELFRKRYPSLAVPEKLPMSRPADEWLKGWQGPSRPEFIPGCVAGLSGEQKLLVYSLEKFLNFLDRKERK